MKKWMIVTLLATVFIVLKLLSPIYFQTREVQPDFLEPPAEILKSHTGDDGMVAVDMIIRRSFFFIKPWILRSLRRMFF